MTPGTHRIRRQCWQVRADSPAAALALRQTLRSELDGALARAFERAFDALGLGDRVLHLPRLTLSIRLQEGDDFLTTLAEHVERAVTEQLQQLIRDEAGRQSPRPVAPQTSWREVLLAYLRDGTVAWHAATIPTPELLTRLRESAQALVSEPRSVIDQLGAGAEERLRASFRLLQLLEPSVLTEFLKSLAVLEAPEEPLRTLRLRVAESVRTLDYPRLRALAILVALRPSDLRPPWSPTVAAWMAECAKAFEITEFIAGAIVQRLPPATSAEPSTERAKPFEKPEPGASASVQRLPPPTGVETLAGAQHPAEEVDAPIVVESAAPEQSPPVGRAPPGLAPVTKDDARPAAPLPTETVYPIAPPVPAVPGLRATEEPMGVLVPHAGLVLLHPFLPQLFGAVGVVRPGEKALTVDQLPRSAALLHWLAVGRTEVYEFELPLVKVLLGISPENPLSVAAGLLSESDRAEGDALLAAVVEHWSALGKTSIDGLRGSFLRRRGLLRAGERGWQLQMESESFDVLLGRLPWAVGIVKLPWMPTPMFIDWPTP
jgi:hypothetical protein